MSDIIESFLNKNYNYVFVQMDGDASTKKKFYKITKENKYLDMILVRVDTFAGNFDESFEESVTNLSQYDYFKHTSEIMKTPKIYAHNDEHGLIVMEYVGDIKLKDYLLEDILPEKRKNLYYRMIDLLIEMQSKELLQADIIRNRTFGKKAILQEVELFLNASSCMSTKDKTYIQEQLENLVNTVDFNTTTLCHRDFQTKNIMYYDNNLYLIDNQDMCMGPYLQDLICLLYESSVILSEQSRQDYAFYYYTRNQHMYKTFTEFYKQVQALGLFRILKGYGTHINHFLNRNRWESFTLMENNRLLLESLQNTFPNIINTINKYRFTGVILAAGRGKRMGESSNDKPKALCEVNGKSMLLIILDRMVKLHPDKIVIVVGYKKEEIFKTLQNYPYKNIEYVEQKELLGTGHSVLQTYDLLHDYKYNCLVHFGDNPNIQYETLGKLIQCHVDNMNDMTLGTQKDEPSYTRSGKIIKRNNKVVEIYEDPNPDYVSDEFLGGVQIYKSKPLFDSLNKVGNNNKQKEYYLTDIVKIAVDNFGYQVGSFIISKDELINVNTKEELILAEQLSVCKL